MPQHKSLAIIYCCYNSKVVSDSATFLSKPTLGRIFGVMGENILAEKMALHNEGLETNAFRAHVARRDDVGKYILELTTNLTEARNICNNFENLAVNYLKTTSCAPKTIEGPSLISMCGRCDLMISTHTYIYGHGYQSAAEQLATYFFLCREFSTEDMNFTFKVIPENKYTTFTATTRNMEDDPCGVRIFKCLGVVFFC